eukprot:COSAG02_NODE_21479_length_786_cov_1.259098_1_plen_99_part_00
MNEKHAESLTPCAPGMRAMRAHRASAHRTLLTTRPSTPCAALCVVVRCVTLPAARSLAIDRDSIKKVARKLVASFVCGNSPYNSVQHMHGDYHTITYI